MKNYSVVILFFALPFCSFSQQINDSITIYIENQLELIIAVGDYDQLRDSTSDISYVLEKFQAYLPQFASELNSKTADLINYYPDSSISIEKGEQKNTLLIDGDQLRNTGSRDIAIIKSQIAKITLTTKDLTKITNINLVDCYRKVVKLLPEKTRLSRVLYYQCIDGNVTAIEEKNKTKYTSGGDVIEINAGVGASLVKNQLVGDFTFKLGFGFGCKGVYHSNPYVSVNLMYDFSEGNRMNINTFLNLGHNWTIPKKIDKSALVGLEIGYLISRNGELFEENTFRLGINYELPSGFSLSPQLFMGDGFKRFYPGVRIGFEF